MKKTGKVWNMLGIVWRRLRPTPLPTGVTVGRKSSRDVRAAEGLVFQKLREVFETIKPPRVT